MRYAVRTTYFNHGKTSVSERQFDTLSEATPVYAEVSKKDGVPIPGKLYRKTELICLREEPAPIVRGIYALITDGTDTDVQLLSKGNYREAEQKAAQLKLPEEADVKYILATSDGKLWEAASPDVYDVFLS